MEIISRIREFNKRYDQWLMELKYKFMLENNFRFFRGTCHLFYEDLSKTSAAPSSPLTWICGDLHVENFGSYRADNQLVYFDLNDFNEALLAPASWELSRMVTSILVAFKSLKINERKALKMSRLFLKIYSNTLARGNARYIEPKVAKGIVYTFLTAVAFRKQEQMLRKRTFKKDKKLRLSIDDTRHFKIEKSLRVQLKEHLDEWMKSNASPTKNYETLDVVFRIAGTGSIGLKRYCFLLQNMNPPKDYLLLDMKQATPSCLAPYINIPQPQWKSEAHRIITIQSRMQNVSPALLNTTMFMDEPFTIQEMQPSEDKINFKVIKHRYEDIYQVIADMAMLTASAQLRSSGHLGAAVADDLIAFGDNDQWQEVMLDFALQYADQVDEQYARFTQAYKEDYFRPAIID